MAIRRSSLFSNRYAPGMKRFQPSSFSYGILPGKIEATSEALLTTREARDAATLASGSPVFPVFKAVGTTILAALAIEVIAGEISERLIRPMWGRYPPGCPKPPKAKK